MKHEDEVRLRHLLDAAKKAVSIVGAMSQSEFLEDEVIGLAAVRLIEVCGEAAKGVSKEYREARPEVPWTELARTRDRLIHGYFDVDLEVVFRIVVEDLPTVIEAVEKCLS